LKKLRHLTPALSPIEAERVKNGGYASTGLIT
jgi:hypothetical protein